MFDEYAAADVLVLASASEGWPKAIVEAMAFGVVCIGNDSGMVPAILSEGRGFTVRPGDSDAVHWRLHSLVADPAELARRRPCLGPLGVPVLARGVRARDASGAGPRVEGRLSMAAPPGDPWRRRVGRPQRVGTGGARGAQRAAGGRQPRRRRRGAGGRPSRQRARTVRSPELAGGDALCRASRRRDRLDGLVALARAHGPVRPRGRSGPCGPSSRSEASTSSTSTRPLSSSSWRRTSWVVVRPSSGTTTSRVRLSGTPGPCASWGDGSMPQRR